MKAVILCAGKGERMRPLTDYKPKCLLPLANKPLLDYQIEMLKKVGIDEIGLVVGYLDSEIREYLKNKNLKVHFYRDDKIRGTASALFSARNFLDEDFVLVYGDVFFDGNFSQIVKTRNSIGVVFVEDVSRYGKVIEEGGYLEKVEEKTGKGSGMINAGIYHLEPNIIDIIEDQAPSKRGEYELTDSISEFSKKNPVRVVRLSGYWKDIGYPWDYLDANLYLLEKIKFSIGENTTIWNTAILRKPVIIGDNCTIKNSVVERSIIGNNCTVGEFSVVKRSIIMDNSNVPHFNYVGDSIIAENTNLGAGTKIANLRFDEKNVKMKIKDKIYDTKRRKFGAVIGYNVKTGINVSIYPGVRIGSDVWIGAEQLIRRNVQNGEKII